MCGTYLGAFFIPHSVAAGLLLDCTMGIQQSDAQTRTYAHEPSDASYNTNILMQNIAHSRFSRKGKSKKKKEEK